MIVFVLVGMVLGIGASGYALAAGTSFLFAFSIYAAVGTATLGLVLLRQWLCQALKSLRTRDALDGQSHEAA